MSPFEDLIKELGSLMGLPLKPDANQSCRLVFENGPTIQIDLHSSAEKVLVGSELPSFPRGSYREKLFLQALRFNGSEKKPSGVFAYSEKKERLILFQFLPLVTLKAEHLFLFLQDFYPLTLTWEEAMKRGEVPQLEQEPSKSSGFYGLK